jgi:hypothetical protein
LSPRDQSDGRSKNPYGLTVPSDYTRAGALAASREGGPRLLNLRRISHRWEPNLVAQQQLQECKRRALQPDDIIAREISSCNGHK